jgi:hypothetical protein
MRIKELREIVVAMADSITIDVSRHAVVRYAERFSTAWPEKLEAEIRENLRAGRVDTARPRGVWELDNTSECLFVWTEDERRIFVLTPNRYDDGTSFAVTTVIKMRHA